MILNPIYGDAIVAAAFTIVATFIVVAIIIHLMCVWQIRAIQNGNNDVELKC